MLIKMLKWIKNNRTMYEIGACIIVFSAIIDGGSLYNKVMYHIATAIILVDLYIIFYDN